MAGSRTKMCLLREGRYVWLTSASKALTYIYRAIITWYLIDTTMMVCTIGIKWSRMHTRTHTHAHTHMHTHTHTHTHTSVGPLLLKSDVLFIADRIM